MSWRGKKRNRFLGVALVGLVAAVLICPTAQAKMTLKDKVGEKELKLQIYGFSQFEMRGGEGWELSKGRAGDGLDFSAQRIRVGFNYFHAGPVAGKLFLDFNQSHTSGEAGLPKMIKDAFVAYKHSNAGFIRLGMIKTPLGMDFTVPGWNLDIIERNGLEKGLVLERNFGLMLSGRLIGQDNFTDKPMKTNGLEMGTERQGYGFGYDIGVFNPSGRSSAVTWSASSSATQAGGTARGDALSYVGRVHWDHGKALHAEIAYGISEQAGGWIDDHTTPGIVEKSEDYEVFDIGIASELMKSKLELKGEYISGTGIRGVKDREQTTYVLTAGYVFVPWSQFVLKYYAAEHTAAPVSPGVSGVKTELQNLYIGLNFYPLRVSDKHRDLQRNKIVVNYIMASGDDKDATIGFQGLGGYDADAWGIQWQYKF